MSSEARRQLQAGRKRIQQLFARGFVPEELGTKSRVWPWVSSSDPFLFSPTNDQLEHDGEELALEELALEELHRLETDIAMALAAKQAISMEKLRGWSEQLLGWLKSYITPEGLLRSQPWRTETVLPALTRLSLLFPAEEWEGLLENRFVRVAEMVLRGILAHGRLFSQELDGAPSAGMRSLLAFLSGANRLRAWYNVPRWLWPGAGPTKPLAQPPTPGIQSDEARIALLRRDWSEIGPVLAVDFREKVCQVDFRLHGNAILWGQWETRLQLGGQASMPTGPWHATCWHADHDGEYLELAQNWAGGVVLERQIFLARTLPFLLLSDAVRVSQKLPVTISWRLPSPVSTGLEGNTATRSQSVRGLAHELRLLPVGLPAEPLAYAEGQLRALPMGWELTMNGSGGNLTMPLALTWAARRVPDAQAPWRQVTITAERQRVDSTRAIALRIPILDQQIIFFRAFTLGAAYAFLGYQTFSECMIGELRKTGTMHEWVLVSPASAS